MKRFVAGADRGQSTLLPECLDDFIDESNPVRVIDVFVDTLDLAGMSFRSRRVMNQGLAVFWISCNSCKSWLKWKSSCHGIDRETGHDWRRAFIHQALLWKSATALPG